MITSNAAVDLLPDELSDTIVALWTTTRVGLLFLRANMFASIMPVFEFVMPGRKENFRC